MCRAYFTVFPCHHVVLTSWQACTPDVHPQNCNPANLTLYLTSFHSDDSEDLPTCPASKLGRPCSTVPQQPAKFAEYCMSKNISLEDAIAIAPAWLYNLQGDRIGTRRQPWRLNDYVIALGLARNPLALQNLTKSTDRNADKDEQYDTKKSHSSREDLEDSSIILKAES